MRRLLIFFAVFLSMLFVYSPLFGQVEKRRSYYDIGVFAFEEGDYAKAESNFKKALEFAPDDLLVNQMLGKTYLEMEKYRDAERFLKIVLEADPSLSGLKFDLASVQYKLGDYSKAATLFTDAAKDEPDNILAHYYAGISLFKIKKYQEALPYFIFAADKSPTVRDNGYFYSGVCYQKTGDTEKAIEKFEFLKEHAGSEALRENALRFYQSLINIQKAQKPYSLYLEVGYQYDDNVTLEPVDEDIIADESDYAAILFFSGKYNVINKKSYQIGAGYSHYQTLHRDLSEYDMTGFIGSFFGKYILHPITYSVSYFPTYYQLDDKGFIMRHQIKPEITLVAGESGLFRIGYSYYINNHLEDPGRSGHTNEGKMEVIYILSEKKGFISAWAGLDFNSAANKDYDFNQFKAQLGASYNIWKQINLAVSGKMYDKSYNNVDSFFGVKRNDKKYIGAFSLSRNIFYEWLTIIGEIEYTKNNSNIDDFEYESTVSTLSLSARY